MPAVPNAAAQIAGFIDKYDPKVARQIRSARTALRKRLPTAVELVYDNYQFLVFGFSSTTRPSDCMVQLVASPKGVALAFYYGATLPDPHGILQGNGAQNRFIRLPSTRTLAEPPVEALIRAAVTNARTPLPKTGRGMTIVQSVSAKQRPRRNS